MKTACLICFALLAGMTARADFSYTSTRKSGAGAGGTTKYFFKGQRMMTDSAETTMILDFDAQTMTSINKTQKTYTVRSFSDLNLDARQGDMKVDVKETGQRKNINGYDAKELLMTMEMAAPRAGMKMQMEMSMWVSSDVPGKQELREFYKRNMEHFPWSVVTGQANPQMQQAMADLTRKMAAMDGVTVLQVIKVKGAGGDAQNAQMQAQMAQMKARLEEMQKQGGPAAAQAQQALARMGGMAGGSGSMFESETESSNFSTGGIPDSTFAIPAGFQKVDRK
jgi:hypothetical protein